MLREQLNLTAEQQEQMHKIWSGVDASARQHFEQRRAFAEDRDKAIAELLTPEQKPKYDQIRQDYDRKLAELSQERKLADDQAVEKTKQILVGDEVAKYEELIKRQRERGPGGARGRFGGAPQGEGAPGPAGGTRSRPAQEIESNAPRVGE
jgi:cell division protein ZapA (FtsZ GTPase activity inhibitor)